MIPILFAIVLAASAPAGAPAAPAAHVAAPVSHTAPTAKASLSPEQMAKLRQALQTQAPPVQTAPQPFTWFQVHAGWLTHTVAGLFVIAAIALVALLAAQTTKQEGLSGTLGGRVESAYRGRLGAEEQIKRLTGIVAGTFVIAGLILSLTGI